MNPTSEDKRSWPRVLRSVFHWVIPIAVLGIVFWQLDLDALLQTLARMDPWLAALALLFTPAVVCVGALRWYVMLRRSYGSRSSIGFAFHHYWLGIPLGRLAPASVGWDIYRVVAGGRYLGGYGRNAAIIVVEKLLSLITCMLMIVILYPLVPIAASPVIEQLLQLAYLLLFVALAAFAGVAFARRSRVLSLLVLQLENRSASLVERVRARFGQDEEVRDTRIPLQAMMEPLASPAGLVPVLLLSFCIQLLSAVRTQIVFRAIGYDLPFVVNLFTAPVMFVIFALPITFAGLGVREAAYILIYGLFGVPLETALVASFFGLLGGLLNSLIASVYMMLSNVRREGASGGWPEQD